jgi:hypothetical protein
VPFDLDVVAEDEDAVGEKGVGAEDGEPVQVQGRVVRLDPNPLMPAETLRFSEAIASGPLMVTGIRVSAAMPPPGRRPSMHHAVHRVWSGPEQEGESGDRPPRRRVTRAMIKLVSSQSKFVQGGEDGFGGLPPW